MGGRRPRRDGTRCDRVVRWCLGAWAGGGGGKQDARRHPPPGLPPDAPAGNIPSATLATTRWSGTPCASFTPLPPSACSHARPGHARPRRSPGGHAATRPLRLVGGRSQRGGGRRRGSRGGGSRGVPAAAAVAGQPCRGPSSPPCPTSRTFPFKIGQLPPWVTPCRRGGPFWAHTRVPASVAAACVSHAAVTAGGTAAAWGGGDRGGLHGETSGGGWRVAEA